MFGSQSNSKREDDMRTCTRCKHLFWPQMTDSDRCDRCRGIRTPKVVQVSPNRFLAYCIIAVLAVVGAIFMSAALVPPLEQSVEVPNMPPALEDRLQQLEGTGGF